MTDSVPGGNGAGNEGGAGAGGAGGTPVLPEITKDLFLGALPNDDVRGYVTNKGWDHPSKAVQSYQELEKLFGADKAGRTLVVPKPDAKPEEWNPIWEKLGRPAAAADYGIPEPLKDDPMAKAFQEGAHKLNLTRDQYNGVMAFVQQQSEQSNAASLNSFTEQQQADRAQLVKEWGKDYEANMEIANRAADHVVAKLFPSDAEAQDKFVNNMIGSVGLGTTRKLFQMLGGLMQEAKHHGSFDSPVFDGKSSLSAAAERASLMRDSDFKNRWINGDIKARQQIQQLDEVIARAKFEQAGQGLS